MFIILVAASRPYLQVHWFSDVLVGCVVGCGYAIGLWFLLGKKEIKWGISFLEQVSRVIDHYEK